MLDKNKIAVLYEEFGAKDESELLTRLVIESFTIPCILCGREFVPDELDFSSDDPICFACGQKNKGKFQHYE